MKKLSVLLICLGFLSIMSCKSLEDMSVTDLASNIPTDSVTSAVSGGVDFKKGEVLCGFYDEDSMTKNTYHVAKVTTPASPATKNQAQALFLDGKEKWTKFVIPSHKASKNEMLLGKYVLFMNSSNYEDMDSDHYRKNSWYLGKITSTDELFKNMVEVKGTKYYVKWIRIPETIVK